MQFETTPAMWNVEAMRWSELSEPDRTEFAAIVASYGGTDRQHGGFRRYRVAEVCARSIRTVLRVETTVRLTVSPET
jgi:hypothetical protein